MSMVRSIAEMHKKLATWSHSKDMDWSPEFETWMMAHAAPQYAAIASQLDMSSRRRHLWPVRLSAAACKLLDRSPVDIANIQANREKARGETGIMRGTWRSYLIPAIGRVTGAVKRRLPGKPRGEVAELQGVTDGK